jgi:hypothetical protein
MLMRIQRYNTINILKFKTPLTVLHKPYAPQHVENHFIQLSIDNGSAFILAYYTRKTINPMKIKKDQQKELKKIESCLQKVEVISSQINLNLEDISSLMDFPNFHDKQFEEAKQLNRSRQHVFEMAKQISKKGEKVSVTASAKR